MSYDVFYPTEAILDGFFRISTLLSSPSSVDDILQKVLDEIVETMGFQRGIICLLDEKKECLITKVVKNYSPEEAERAFSQNLNINKHECLETRVVKSGRYIALEDSEKDPRITDTDRKITHFYKRGSTFYAALKIEKEVIGIISLWSKEKAKFSEEEINILLTFANQISIVIHNTRLFEDNRKRIDRLLLLQEAVAGLIGNYSLDSLHETVVQHAVRIGGAERAFVYFQDVERQKHLVSDGKTVAVDQNHEAHAKINREIVKQALETEQIVCTSFPGETSAALPGCDAVSCLAIPFRIKDKFRGVLYLEMQKGSFSTDQINFLDILVKNAAASYDNAIMHSLLSREAKSLKKEVEMLKEREDKLLGFHNILGGSKKMQGLFHVIREVSKHNTNILIQGESGTGKELFARAIHRQGDRRSMRFVDVNCAAIPGTLLESELFGYEAGAFTDARKRKVGLLEYANGGTMFLDEIGDMSFPLQAKFLRMLEDGYIRRLGGTENIPTDVRFIFATNRDLGRMVAEGHFREDLYYRISVVPVILPPLREREDDILLLARHYIQEFNEKLNKHVRGFTTDAEAILLQYSWPGNVRELKNIIERVMILQNVGTLITGDDLPREIRSSPGQGRLLSPPEVFLPESGGKPVNYRMLLLHVMNQVKERLLRKTLELSGGNKSEAARRLGISRYALLRELKKIEQDRSTTESVGYIQL
jgi:transcriptional regulator with GAF, ATPase, and Fis domain